MDRRGLFEIAGLEISSGALFDQGLVQSAGGDGLVFSTAIETAFREPPVRAAITSQTACLAARLPSLAGDAGALSRRMRAPRSPSMPSTSFWMAFAARTESPARRRARSLGLEHGARRASRGARFYFLLKNDPKTKRSSNAPTVARPRPRHESTSMLPKCNS